LPAYTAFQKICSIFLDWKLRQINIFRRLCGAVATAEPATQTSIYHSQLLLGHTGQSSQLFPVANARNAQFPPAVATALQSRQADLTVGSRITFSARSFRKVAATENFGLFNP
jgi:hypothetical protein